MDGMGSSGRCEKMMKSVSKFRTCSWGRTLSPAGGETGQEDVNVDLNRVVNCVDVGGEKIVGFA